MRTHSRTLCEINHPLCRCLARDIAAPNRQLPKDQCARVEPPILWRQAQYAQEAPDPQHLERPRVCRQRVGAHDRRSQSLAVGQLHDLRLGLLRQRRIHHERRLQRIPDLHCKLPSRSPAVGSDDAKPPGGGELHAQVPAHISGAACSSNSASGSLTVVAGSATMYSAKAPSCWKPAVSRLSQNLGSSPSRPGSCSVRFDRPQPLQLPQAFLKLRTPTLSPTCQLPKACAPTCTITPAGSCEGIMPSGDLNWPCSVCRSEWQKPAAWMRTRSSCGLMVGTGFEVMQYGFPYC